MTIEEMKARKKELGYTNQMIAILSGVPIGTVSKVFAGITSSPRYDTIKALEQVLLPESVKVYEKAAETEPADTSGDPEDDAVHNILSVRFTHALTNCLDSPEGGNSAIVMTAPFDVQISPDCTVRPDIFVVSSGSALKARRVSGPPELIIEIATKRTLAEDLGEKQVLYRKSGVREYWVVDVSKHTLIAFRFEGGFEYNTYSFSDTVPIGITDEALKVDLSGIRKYLDW